MQPLKNVGFFETICMFLAHAYSSFLWLKKKKKRRNRFSSGNHVGSGHMPSKSQSHIQLLEQNGVLLLLLTLAVCVCGGGVLLQEGSPSQPWDSADLGATVQASGSHLCRAACWMF